jgi:hypothetical protein
MASLPLGGAIPAVFGLLPNKLARTYRQFFKIVAGLSDEIFIGELCTIYLLFY